MTYSIGFYGDFSTGENYQMKYDRTLRINSLRQYGYLHLFEHVEKYFTLFDFNILNLETPLTNQTKSTLADKKIVHWADMNIVPELLKKYNIGAVSLGNNHAMDYDKTGLTDTMKALNNAGISYFGAGLNLNWAQKPLIKNIKVGDKQIDLFVLGGYKYRDNYETDLNYYAKPDKEGVFMLTPETAQDIITAVKFCNSNAFFVVFPHFGFDHSTTTPLQKEYAHAFIDAGADMVIGHGPHMMNSAEKYKDKIILYGIGNFIFNANFKGKIMPYNLVAGLQFSENSVKTFLYPTYMDCQSYTPVTRPITQNETEIVVKLLTDGNADLNYEISNLDELLRIEIL